MLSDFLNSSHELHKYPVLAKQDGGKVPKKPLKGWKKKCIVI